MGRYSYDPTTNTLTPIAGYQIADNLLSSNSTNPVQNKIIKEALDTKAPTNHASNNNTYGLGTSNNYGHNKIVDNLTSTALTDGESLSAHMGNTLGSDIAYINTNSSTASKAYTSGEQFILDGILRKATTAIAQDATLTLNTNYENAPSVTSQISNLKQVETRNLVSTVHGLTVLYRRYGNIYELLISGTTDKDFNAGADVGFGNVQIPNFENYVSGIEFNSKSIIIAYYTSSGLNFIIRSEKKINAGSAFKVSFFWVTTAIVE